MTLVEAFAALQEGKQVTRTAWERSKEYLVLLPNVPNIWKINVQGTPGFVKFTPEISDFLGEDWKLLPVYDIL